MEVLFQFGVIGVLLILGYFVGSAREKKHYQSIILRHAKYKHIPVRVEKVKDLSNYSEAQLFTGNVVIANDYFKNFVASFKSLFGGRLNSFESLMDRARRESILRIKEKAAAWGADEIIELRLETSAIDKSGIEVLAYATAVKRHVGKNEISPVG